jgi:ammonia channel protein AmtB
VAVGVFSFVVSGLIGLGIKAASPKGIRVSEEVEDEGLDINLHSEVGYSLDRV